MRQPDFLTPWLVINGTNNRLVQRRVAASFDSEASARLYIEVRELWDATVVHLPDRQGGAS